MKTGQRALPELREPAVKNIEDGPCSNARAESARWTYGTCNQSQKTPQSDSANDIRCCEPPNPKLDLLKVSDRAADRTAAAEASGLESLEMCEKSRGRSTGGAEAGTKALTIVGFIAVLLLLIAICLLITLFKGEFAEDFVLTPMGGVIQADMLAGF